MYLLCYLVAIGMQRLYPADHPLRPLFDYGRYASWFHRWLQSLGAPGWMSSVLMFLLPFLFVWFLSASTSGLLHLLVSLLLVVYAVDLGRFDELLDQARAAESEDEVAQSLDSLARSEFASLQRYLLWLFLTGPLGMVLVRLLEQHLNWETETEAETDHAGGEQEVYRPAGGQGMAARLLFVADWLSGRAASLLLALTRGPGALRAWSQAAASLDRSGLDVFAAAVQEGDQGPVPVAAVAARLNRLLLGWALLYLLIAVLLSGPPATLLVHWLPY